MVGGVKDRPKRLNVALGGGKRALLPSAIGQIGLGEYIFGLSIAKKGGLETAFFAGSRFFVSSAG